MPPDPKSMSGAKLKQKSKTKKVKVPETSVKKRARDKILLGAFSDCKFLYVSMGIMAALAVQLTFNKGLNQTAQSIVRCCSTLILIFW
jgi:hypothetical protein